MPVVVKKVSRNIRVESKARAITVRRSNRNILIKSVGRRGPQGNPGNPGDPGPPGSDATDKNFEFILSGQTDVVVPHNLNKFPAISIFDSAGDEVEGWYQHININSARLRFSAGFGGKAIFN